MTSVPPARASTGITLTIAIASRSRPPVCTAVAVVAVLSSVAARGRLLVMSEVGSKNKISHAPGRAAAPASPKLLLHTLPAALLLALKQPPCNPSHSRVRKARGPRRDKPIVLLAAIRREMLTLSMPAKTLAVVVSSAAVCHKHRGG